MRLVELEIKNFKCFKYIKINFNERISLFRWPNGTGKSSVIEAIMLCLYNKRPLGLPFEDLVKTGEKEAELNLTFMQGVDEWLVERKFGGSKNVNNLYKNGELVGRAAKDNYETINNFMPENITSGIWCTDSLALSPILKTDYLFQLLEQEFVKPLAMKQHFTSMRSMAQKQIKPLEGIISKQTITEKELTDLLDKITALEKEIKNKVFIDDREVIKARSAKEESIKHNKLKEQLTKSNYVYNRETCLGLYKYAKMSEDQFNNYFISTENELLKTTLDYQNKITEKRNKGQAHPLVKYPKQTIDKLIKDSKETGKCILCNQDFIEPVINYDTIDLDKITRLENELKQKTIEFNKVLEDRKYNYKDIISSIEYWTLKKQVDDLSYLDEWDWQSILDNYDSESKKLYEELENTKTEYEEKKQAQAKQSELLKLQEQYNDARECIRISQEYIDEAKASYSASLLSHATKILNSINSRYEKLVVEDGAYRVNVLSESGDVNSLPVQLLSKGEKTIVALSLLLTVRNLFLKGNLLVMDEAFTNLDEDNKTAVINILREDKGQWVIVSHELYVDGVKEVKIVREY